MSALICVRNRHRPGRQDHEGGCGAGDKARPLRSYPRRSKDELRRLHSCFAGGPSSDVTERIPLKGVRAIIADRMGTSVHTTARVTLMMEIDATEFVAVRERLKAKVAEEWGFAPGQNDLLARMVAKAVGGSSRL